MKLLKSTMFFKLSILFVIASVSLSAEAHGVGRCNVHAIFQLGDSTSDTGNFIRLIGSNATGSYAGRLPYGETYGVPTGRYSDGLLIIDYFAKAFKLPLVNPIEAKNDSFKHGANFAVAGSTVLNASFYAERNVTPLASPDVPLRKQLEEFKAFLNSSFPSQTKAKERLEKSLIVIGEMGSNDFLYSFLERKSIEEVTTYVPYLVGETIDVTRELIQLGATRIVVFGDFPIGCSPIYLTVFKTNNSDAYDRRGCLIPFNEFEQYRNNYVQQELAKLRSEFPNVTISYGDYYNGFEYVLNNTQLLGFDANSTLKACCGIGGAYNFNTSAMCGTDGVNLCQNPSQYISWDGVHLTQQAHRYITGFVLGEIFPQLCLQ